MRHFRIIALLAAAFTFVEGSVHAQGLGGRFMFGFGAGTQRLSSDFNPNGLRIGGEGLVGYRLNDRFGVTLAAGYATFPFILPVSASGSGNVVPLRTPVTTKMIYGNLLFDMELINRGKFHPYIMFGVGGYNFRYSNITTTANKKNVSGNDASGIGGLGFRVLVSPNMAINVNGAYHYTTSDALDASAFGSKARQNGNNDAYFSGRVGLTFFKGGSPASGDERELFSEEEQAPIEESEDGFDEFAEEGAEEQSENESTFASRLDELDNSANGGDDAGMQEYIRLKSQVDEINQDIDSKEREITSLLAAVAESKKQVGGAQKKASTTPPPVITGASFSRQYEQALQTFYLKRYPEAIQMFTDLVERFPAHSLTSSCQYWIGEAQFHAGNYSEAVAMLNKVLESARSMKKDDALLFLGQSYAQLNRVDDARQALNRLLQEFPGSEYASKAEALLSKM
ncbi:tetratricopeptide repeat protein [candidate division KSB1 bacterium]|nr:tetratricopeptide repeat protein [candidate division KSB1 bacterium]